MLTNKFLRQWRNQAKREIVAQEKATKEFLKLYGLLDSVKHELTAEEFRVLKQCVGPGMIRYRISQYEREA